MLTEFPNDFRDFNPFLSWAEIQSLKQVTNRFFTFLTNRPSSYPEDIIFSINKNGFREARYFIACQNVQDYLIFPELVLGLETRLNDGSHLLKATVDIHAMDIDEYRVGFMSYNSSRRFAPFTSYWLEDVEMFHPVSMTTQLSVGNNNYQLAFINNGGLLKASTNDAHIIKQLNEPILSHNGIISINNTIDLHRFMIKLSKVLNSHGIQSSHRSTSRAKISILDTLNFALSGNGYNITDSGDIIPLLIYR